MSILASKKNKKNTIISSMEKNLNTLNIESSLNQCINDSINRQIQNTLEGKMTIVSRRKFNELSFFKELHERNEKVSIKEEANENKEATTPFITKNKKIENCFRDEVHNGKSISKEIYDKYKSHFKKIAKTNDGTIAIQNSIKKTSALVLNLIAQELMENLYQVFKCKFGNYVIQKIYPFLTLENKLKVLNSIDFFIIGSNQTGTYALQSIVESIETKEERRLCLAKIQPNFMTMVLNGLCCHIVEKVLLKNEYLEIKNLFGKLIQENFLLIATDSNGIKIMKFFSVVCCLTEDYDLLSDYLYENLECLIKNQYGNYLIQCIIDSWPKEYILKIAKITRKNYISLMADKFASNVIERLIISLDVVS